MWVARTPRSTVAGLAVTLKAAPVSGSVAEALGTCSVPAWTATVWGEVTLRVISGLRAVTPIRRHWYPMGSAKRPASSSFVAARFARASRSCAGDEGEARR